MPPVVAAVVAAAAWISVNIGWITAVVTLASVAYSAYMMASMKKPGASSDATTRLQTVRSSVQPHRVVYGECMTGGVLVYAQSHGDNNKFISLVVAFTAHEVDAIKEVWLNEKLSSDIAFVKHIAEVPAEGYWAPSGEVWTLVGEYPEVSYTEPSWVETKPAIPAHDESWAQVTKYLGTQSQAADPLLMGLDPQPTTVISKFPESGLNDLSTTGDYSAVGMAVFTISISAVGSTDSFHWSDDLGHSGTLAMTGASQLLVNGISVTFAAKTGHSIGQIWELRAFDGAPWTAECTLTGCSYVVVTLEKSDTAFPNGLPNIKALIRGNNQIYDPATGTSGYSDNWALCVRDYLTKPYGLGAPAEDINEATAIAARNICDEMVTTTTGAQKRYTLNGSFTVDKTPVSIMNEILATAYGAITWTQGQYRIFPAAYYAPDMTFHGMNAAIPGLTESDLRAGIKVRPMPSMKDRFNTVKGTYISPETWQEVDFPSVTNALYVAEDGGEIVKDIQLSYVTDPARAQRIAKLMLEKSRQGIVVDFPAKWSAFPLAVGDTVPISVSRLGWDQKIFSVRDWKMNPDGGVDLSLQEDAAACYSWNSGEETTVDLAQNTILPDPRFAPVPTGMTIGEEQYSTVTVGAIKSRAIVTWDDMGAAQYQVDYLPPNNTIWAALPPTANTTVTIDDVMAGTYQIRVRSMNYLGVWSDWNVAAQIMNGKSLPPSDVSGFSATFAGNLIKLAWIPINEPDLAGYEIRTGASWDTGTILQAALMGNGYTYRPTASGTITHWIKAFDTAGNESVTAATSAAVVPVPDVPTAITATAQFLSIDLAITYDLSRQDTAGVQIWAATTNNRDTAALVGASRDGRWQQAGLNNAEFRYYWARCVSVFDEVGAWYPTSATAGVLGATLNEPTQAIKLLNGDISSSKLSDYLSGTGSFSSVVNTFTPAAVSGVGVEGVFATEDQIVSAKITILDDAILLKASNDDLSGQVLILSDMIGLKLDATGTVGPGLAIAWQDDTHTKSVIRVQSDLFQVGDDTGSGYRNIFSVGNIDGVPAVGVSGDMVIDGSIAARSLSSSLAFISNTLTFGDATHDGIIQTYNYDAAATGIRITGGASPSIVIKGGTLTGSTLQTASSGERFVVDADSKAAHFYDSGGAEKIWLGTAAGDGLNCYAAAGDVTVSTRIGVIGMTYSGNAGVYGKSSLTSGVQGWSTTGLGAYFLSGAFVGAVWSDNGSQGPIRLGPSVSSSAPAHNAYGGTLWVTSAGVLYINTTPRATGLGTTWQKVGAQ